MAHPVMHWEIAAKDGKKAQDFYAALFDWKIDANNPQNYGLVDTGGGITGGIFQADGPSRVTLYVQVPDLQETLNKAESLGAKVVMPPTDVPGGPTIALFTDPEGTVVGLLK